MNAIELPLDEICPEGRAHLEYMARFEAKHGMQSLAEFNKLTSDTPRPRVAYAPDDEDEFATDTKSSEPTERATQSAQLTPQPLSALEKLQASGPADIEDIIAAFKADNGIVGTPRQERRSRRKPSEIAEMAQAARQYLEQDGGAQPVEAVLAAVLDATGLTVPESGSSRTRFLSEAGIESRRHYRTGRTGCEYTEWSITQDSPVNAPSAFASNPDPHSQVIPSGSAATPAQIATNPERIASNPPERGAGIASNRGPFASNLPARLRRVLGFTPSRAPFPRA